MTKKIVVPVSYFKGSPKSTLFSIDMETKQISVLGEYLGVKKAEVKGKGFTQIVSTDSFFIVADYNQFHFIDKTSGKIINTFSSEVMNDLHGICIYNNFIIITNTGFDSLEIYNMKGTYIDSISLIGFESSQDRYCGKASFDKVDSYYDNDIKKPFCERIIGDCFHLNNTIVLKGQIISTSFERRTLIKLPLYEEISPPLEAHIHDCLHLDHKLWVTSVDGKIYYRDEDVSNYLPFIEFLDVFNLGEFYGWCRGLLEHQGDLFVGITQINSHTMKKRWCVDIPAEKTKTGIIRVDIKNKKVVDFYDLTHENISRIFGFVVV